MDAQVTSSNNVHRPSSNIFDIYLHGDEACAAQKKKKKKNGDASFIDKQRTQAEVSP
jgi:hypothetical protein